MTKAKSLLIDAKRILHKKLTTKARADRSIISKASGIKVVQRKPRRKKNGNHSGGGAATEKSITPADDGVAET
jgi:hypothetical protein